jgi:dimethylamine monooxygenase subunit A
MAPQRHSSANTSLGFTAEALAASARGGGALRMGLSRLDEASWLWPDVDRAARAQVFAQHPDSVIVLPGAAQAAAEAARLVSRGDQAGLGAAAARVWEDLCVLQPDEQGAYRLTAAAVGFPTDWRLAEKMGLPLTAIHAPIHGYAEQLAAGVDHFFSSLVAGPIFGRSNWFVVASDAPRYLPQDDPATRFAHVTADNAGETLFLRCERQTLRRLPETGAMLFTIGIALSPFARLSAGLVGRIAGAMTALGSGEHERRAAPHYAGALADYAARRGAGGGAA